MYDFISTIKVGEFGIYLSLFIPALYDPLSDLARRFLDEIEIFILRSKAIEQQELENISDSSDEATR